MEVYLDLLILLNFLVDLLLIIGTNRLAGHPPGVRRALPAAVLGGLYAGVCVLTGWAFLANVLWRFVTLAAMSAIAFGLDQSGLRRGILFVFLSMALGGIALGLGNGGFWSLVLAAGLVCLMCLLGFRGRAGQQSYLPVTLCHMGKTVTLTALADTGNTLRDPVSGSPVLVVDGWVAGALLALSDAQVADPIGTLAAVKLPGLRLIPYSAVGQTAGLLLGIRVDCVRIDGKETACIVAFAPQKLGHGQYQALAGGSI